MAKNLKTNYLTGAEAMVKLLDGHGVKYIFGLCGDTSLPFYDALYRLNHSITYILTRDERHASYMADAYARVTGNVGICEGPSGGGATYIIPGVIEANESSIGLICLTSDVPLSSIGHFPLTELKQKELFKPLTKWNEILDKIIWSFENHDNEPMPTEPENYDPRCNMIKYDDGSTEYEHLDDRPWDWTECEAHDKKVQEGLELFAKHYKDLWA